MRPTLVSSRMLNAEFATKRDILPQCVGRYSLSLALDRLQSLDSGKKKTTSTRWVDTQPLADQEDDDLPLLAIGEQSSHPIYEEVTVNDQRLRMEIDTGAAVSLISRSTFDAVFPGACLEQSSLTLKTYTGEQMTIEGELAAEVKLRGQTQHLPLVVVSGNGPSLLGRNWLQRLRIQWQQIAPILADPGSEANVELHVLLDKHRDLFEEELGTISSSKAKLKVRENAQPKFCKARPVPFALKERIEEQLVRLESSGILEKIDHSEWAALIVAVPKKDGSVRICGDYKMTINQMLDVDQYPLPTPDDLFATLAGGQKFTKLDLAQAYLQLPLEENSKDFLVINSHKGLYRYTRLPFGVASAPAVFQKTMDGILQGLPMVSYYIDDILISGKNDAEHLQNLAKVLARLDQHGIRLRRNKCEFLKDSVEYLGHRIDAEGLHTSPEKVKAIQQAPTPSNVVELRSFLGLLNYYGKFVSNLSSILQPLNSCLQQNKQWEWTQECDQAFKEAKDALSSSQVLTHYDPKLPVKMAADASSYGIGAVIAHVLPDGSERPISFASRTLTPAERNYAQIEKEALALVFGVKRFHKYLYGRPFTMVTDHKPLLAILGPKKGIPPLAAARLQRWALVLSAYHYQLEFKFTRDHGNADGLSRLPLDHQPNEDSSADPRVFNLAQIEALPVTSKKVQLQTRNDPVLSKVIDYTTRGWPDQISESFKPYKTRASELSIEADCLLWGMRVVIPPNL